VTVQNRTQLAVEEANRELRTFAHAASHDLKEPLRTMSNFAKLIDRRYADKLDDNGREYIKYINDAASRGTTLVTDLLRFAEVGTDQITTEIVSLNQVAATVKQTVNARLEEEGATLIIDDLPEVIATPTWTQQLLQNLISNALKFKRDDVIPEVHVFAKAVDSFYELHVKDNGIGIAEENLAKVFGVFERLNLREKFEGNGIGLALCQRIMKKLGGSIRVESTFGVGTTFILSFPMLSPEPAQVNRRKVEA
jgi:light-regulated signal transduction histidine kinase (bacteriophytochrome)